MESNNAAFEQVGMDLFEGLYSVLHVPADTKSAWNVYPWNEWFLPGRIVDDWVDGIKEIKNESLTPALSKGEEDWYSLDGRKLGKKPTKAGIYIKNGKKVVVK